MPSQKTTKILVFHPAIAPYRVDFFNRLNERFEVTFFMEHHNVLDQKFDQKALSDRLDFKPQYLDSGFNLLGRSIRFGIFGLLRKHKPEKVLCSEFGQITLFVVLYNKLTGGKIDVYTMCDDSLQNARSRSGLRSAMRSFVSRNVKGVIFPSTEVCNWFSKHISSKTRALELPIIHSDSIFRKYLQNSLEQAKIECNVHKLFNQKVMLFVGRLVWEKNVSVLIQALSAVHRRDWKLIIVGSGDQEEQLKEQIRQLNLQEKIVMTGRKEGEELYAWYTIASLFVLPSIHEPFGAVVNEALIGGCRVLCSRLAGASTLINSENGELFDPNNPDDLTKKLEAMLEKMEPVSEESIVALRKNNMPFTFEEKTDQLFSAL